MHDPKYNWVWEFSCIAISWITKWSWKHLPFATFLMWHHFSYLHWILVQEGPRRSEQKEASSPLQWQKTGFSGPFWPRPGNRSPFQTHAACFNPWALKQMCYSQDNSRRFAGSYFHKMLSCVLNPKSDFGFKTKNWIFYSEKKGFCPFCFCIFWFRR